MVDNQLIFRSFASGSSGNCYFLGTPKWGILIDAGISARTIQKNLREMGLDYANIMGVLITHDHADHIRAVGTLGERVHLPIYSTRDIHHGIDRNYGVREKLRTSQRYFEKGVEWELNGMKINTFGISHDSTECVGYVIDYLGQRFVIATDCGQPDATMEDVVAAAKAAHIHGYISRLPQGYDTVLTDNGTSISKGQKQLLTIARAMLLNANMLILDEATSNVDTRTEHRIQQAMRTLMEGKTCFVIAHRLSTIQSADNILVLDGGKVVEQGNHEQLMAQKGFYYKLYQSQFDSVS